MQKLCSATLIAIIALYVCFTETIQATKVLWRVLNLYKQNNNNY